MVFRLANICVGDWDERRWVGPECSSRETSEARRDDSGDQMHAVDIELRVRGLAARRALLRLFDHPNMQVRLQAAKWSLGVAPDAARQVIESISESNWFPQAGEAGMTLSNLHSGILKPD